MDGVTIIDSRFNSFVLTNAPLEKLSEGFRWLEGPAWFADRQCLLVSDLPNSRIMRWTPSGAMSVVREPSGFANGHTRGREWRLLGCTHGERCIRRTELDGALTVLGQSLQGQAAELARRRGRQERWQGKIAVPFVVANLCFGGRHNSRLFICGSHTLYGMYVNQRGAERPCWRLSTPPR